MGDVVIVPENPPENPVIAQPSTTEVVGLAVDLAEKIAASEDDILDLKEEIERTIREIYELREQVFGRLADYHAVIVEKLDALLALEVAEMVEEAEEEKEENEVSENPQEEPPIEITEVAAEEIVPTKRTGRRWL